MATENIRCDCSHLRFLRRHYPDQVPRVFSQPRMRHPYGMAEYRKRGEKKQVLSRDSCRSSHRRVHGVPPLLQCDAGRFDICFPQVVQGRTATFMSRCQLSDHLRSSRKFCPGSAGGEYKRDGIQQCAEVCVPPRERWNESIRHAEGPLSSHRPRGVTLEIKLSSPSRRRYIELKTFPIPEAHARSAISKKRGFD